MEIWINVTYVPASLLLETPIKFRLQADLKDYFGKIMHINEYKMLFNNSIGEYLSLTDRATYGYSKKYYLENSMRVLYDYKVSYIFADFSQLPFEKLEMIREISSIYILIDSYEERKTNRKMVHKDFIKKWYDNVIFKLNSRLDVLRNSYLNS